MSEMKSISWKFSRQTKTTQGQEIFRDVSQARQSGLDLLVPIAIRHGIGFLEMDRDTPRLVGRTTNGIGGHVRLCLDILDVDGRELTRSDLVQIAERMGAEVPADIMEARRREVADQLFEDAHFGDWTVAATNGWEGDGVGRYARQVFLERDGQEGPSRMIWFAVEFEDGFSFPVRAPEFELPDDPTPVFGYYVNQDERGTFYADVRDAEGETLFEISSDEDGRIDLIEDGFMKHKEDIGGLQEHLASLGIIPANGELCDSAAFEEKISEKADAAPAGPDF